jgi:hypothetical protein
MMFQQVGLHFIHVRDSIVEYEYEIRVYDLGMAICYLNMIRIKVYNKSETDSLER